jgi:fatty-acyl-CoA synthase
MLIRDLNDTAPHILRHSASEVGNRLAIRLQFAGQPDMLITHCDLLRGSAAMADVYRQAGLGQDDVIILILDHGPSLVYGCFGAMLAGAVPSIMPVPSEKIAPDRYRESIAALMRVTHPAAIVAYPELEDDLRRLLPGVETLKALLPLDNMQPPPPREPEADHAPPDADTIALLQHSSGSTGLQKGVALSHRSILNQVESYSQAIRLSDDDVVVSWLPLYHDMGLIAGFLMPVLARIPLVLMSPFDWVRAPGMLLRAVHQHGGTLCWLPNFAYNFLAQKVPDAELEGLNLSSWRAVVNCSEPMRHDSHQMFYRRLAPYGLRREALTTCYAMAENVFAVTQGGFDVPVVIDRVDRLTLAEHRRAEPATGDAPPVEMVSAGVPIAGTQVRVVDGDGRDVPERQVGEIALLSDCMLTGYYHRPDATAAAFLDEWYLTGDLGYLADGHLYITGRKKDLIIVGGKNIYPQDLEALVNQVEGVHPGRVVAFGIPNEQTGTEDVAILAETRTDDQDERRATARRIRQAIAQGSDVVARYVEVLDWMWLIKTSSGKIARTANRDKYLKTFRPELAGQVLP